MITLWTPDIDQLRAVLGGGEARCRKYGIVEPDHVKAIEMLDKLKNRAAKAAGLRCYVCGSPIGPYDPWHLDHVRPLVVGGNHTRDNLEMVHARCNLMKGASDIYSPPVGSNPEPLLVRLRVRNPGDLWDEDELLARKVLIAPRPVPIDTIGELPHLAGTVAVLRAQPDPYLAIGLSELAKRLGISSRGQLDNSMWDKFMGFSTIGHAKGKAGTHHNRRLPPNPLIVPTRVSRGRGQWGRKAFRLRFRVSVGDIDQYLQEGTMPISGQVAYPDHDEIVGEHN